MVFQLKQVWNDHRMRGQFRTMLPALNRFALTLTGSQPDADDLVQMTCKQDLERSPPAQSGDQLQSRLQDAMRIIWSDELPGRQIRDRHAQDERVSPQRASAQDGEALAENRALLHDFEHAILRLPDEERRMLQLVCVQGLSYRKVADITGVPRGTVMSRLARARLHLMEQIKGDGYGSDGNIRTLQPCRL